MDGMNGYEMDDNNLNLNKPTKIWILATTFTSKGIVSHTEHFKCALKFEADKCFLVVINMQLLSSKISLVNFSTESIRHPQKFSI